MLLLLGLAVERVLRLAETGRLRLHETLLLLRLEARLLRLEPLRLSSETGLLRLLETGLLRLESWDGRGETGLLHAEHRGSGRHEGVPGRFCEESKEG